MSGGDAAMGHDRGRSAGPIERGGSPVRGRVTDDVPSGLLHDGLWGGGRPADDEGWIQASGAGGEPPGPPARGVVSIRGRDPQLRSIPSARPYRGRSVRSVPAAGTLRDLAWRDTLVGALSRGRRPAGGDAPLLIPADLRRKRRVHRPGRLVLLAVDLSGSMGGELTALARQVSEAVLRRAYVDRERVAMIAFRATTAELLFDATDQVQRVVRELDGLPLGGTTPLARGLELADRVLDRALGREPALRSTLLLVTDGRANVGSRAGYGSVQAEVQALARALARRERLRTLFLDTTGRGKHDLAARRLARELGARRVRLARVRGLGGDPGVRIEQLLMEEWRA